MSLAAADPLVSHNAAGPDVLPNTWPDALGKNLFALLLTCLVAALLLWLLRRGRSVMPAGPPCLRLLARLPLSDSHVVYLLDAAGRYLLLGGGAGGLALLTEVEAERLPPPLATAPSAPTGSVARALALLGIRGGRAHEPQ